MGKREDGAAVLLNFLVAENCIPDDIVVKSGKTKRPFGATPGGNAGRVFTWKRRICIWLYNDMNILLLFFTKLNVKKREKTCS